MADASPEKSNVANSILAKFQQFIKDMEDASKPKEEPKSYSPSAKIRQKRKCDEILHTGISEQDVGITKYISEHAGFKGIIKHRFTDFQVHEIDLDGNIVELTSTEVTSSISEPVEINRDIISQELWDAIENISKEDGGDEVVEIDVSDKNKSERSVIHKAIKSIFGAKVHSSTVTEEGKTIIKVGKATAKERPRWPENLPSFLHFTLTKKNMDTTHFIYLLSRKLRQKPNSFTYAGTKDRRAVTSQRMCVKKRRAEDLAKETLWGVKLGNYIYKSKPLRLGDLSGNKFTITIRNLQAEDDDINNALENLKRTGFINYFGLQRFGSSAVAPTFQIGKALLKKDWKLGVELILKPRPDEKAPSWVKAAREAWWTSREAGPALKCLRRHQNSIEFIVIQFLKSSPNDFHSALLKIPRNTLLLYLHSYQSYIWNNIVSRRIEKFQLTPQVGDLVIVSNDEAEKDIIDTELIEKAEEEEDEKEEDEEVEAEEETSGTETAGANRKILVRALTAEDVNTTSIYDVVYPLPGHDVELPKNEIADWYTELLSKDNITFDDLKSNNKLFSLYGTYRKPFQKANDLTWKIVKHDNLDDDLVLSDMDKLDNVSLPEQSEDGAEKSLVVDFKLKPSSYATMALREVMKMDTAVSFHAQMTRTVHDEKKLKLSNDEEQSETTNGNNT